MPDWTVVLSQSKFPDLANRLADEHGLTVLALPDLVDLPPGHPALAALLAVAGPVAVAGEYYPRALYWTLASRGLAGRRADFPATATTGRAIHGVDLTGCDAEQAMQRILAVTGSQPGQGAVRDLQADPALPGRWHPVIDLDRCVNCLECVEFCLFGVYDIPDGQHVAVTAPQNCKPGCPACSRVCPSAAIIFPHYHARGPIAGDDQGRPEQLSGDQARHASAPDVEAYRRREETPAQPSVGPETSPTKPLDSLIDELESFDA